MKQVTVVIPYPGSAQCCAAWAQEENKIDFSSETERANRCSAAFAGMELIQYLRRSVRDLDIRIAEQADGHGDSIRLELSNRDSGGGFDYQVLSPRNLIIRGHGRNGLINGVYDFLHLQNWRWIEPGKFGEIVPKVQEEIHFPHASRTVIPSFRYRAFYFEFPSQESEEFLLWMARNKMNVYGLRDSTKKLAMKLGFHLQAGGHVYHSLLAPDRVLPDGRTIFDAHPDWYGTPKNGEKTRQNAQNVQFCVSSPSLLDYLGDELLNLLQTKWRDADIIEISGFDTWGDNCNCHDCKQLGNGTDGYLKFISSLRNRVNRELPRKVMLNSWAYEGTDTLKPGERPIPDNLTQGHDNCVFFPINRCYKHHLDDPACPDNRHYAEAVRTWGKKHDQISLWFGEYYNVSKFEDLPLLFTSEIPASMRFYHANGFKGATFMHVPIINWGVRALTMTLHSRLAWDVNQDMEAILDDYFHARYGRYADRLRGVYEKIEAASLDVSQWRMWFGSILATIIIHHSGAPFAAMPKWSHFHTPDDVISSGENSCKLFSEAAETIRAILNEEKQSVLFPSHDLVLANAVNPVEQEKSRPVFRIEYFLADDLRNLRYGLMVYQLMTEVAAYYLTPSPSRERYQKIEELSQKLEEAFAPIRYSDPERTLFSIPTALSRSQLQEAVIRIRTFMKQ